MAESQIVWRPMKEESREDKPDPEYQEGQEWLHRDGLNKERLVHKTYHSPWRGQKNTQSIQQHCIKH